MKQFYMADEECGDVLPAAKALVIERRRLINGIDDSECILGRCADNRYVTCSGDAGDVLARAKEVLTIFNAQGLSDKWPADDEWPDLLPAWFVEACGPEKSKADFEREKCERLAMTREQQMQYDAVETKWSVSAIAYWMGPRGRLDPDTNLTWVWFDAEIKDENTILVHTDNIGDSQGVAPAALRELFMCCGALDVDLVTMDNREDMIRSLR